MGLGPHGRMAPGHEARRRGRLWCPIGVGPDRGPPLEGATGSVVARWPPWILERCQMVRLQITLDPVEANVLARWAASELRDPRDQIRFVLRQALEQRGLLQLSESISADQCAQAQPPNVIV